MKKNLIFTGGIFHPFDETSETLSNIINNFGYESEITIDIEEGIKNINKYDLITFNALRWRMLNHEKYIPYIDEWQFSLSNKSKILLEDFIKNLPKSFSSPEIRIECKEEEKFKIIENIKTIVLKKCNLSDLLLIDGVRAKTTIGWWLIRASNTQAALIVRAESDSKENLRQLLNLIKNYLKLSGVKEISEKI